METVVEVELKDVPEGHWVVVSGDSSRVVAHDANLEKALAVAEATGVKHLSFFKSVSLGRFLIG